ncbi:ATPase [Oenococcus oeni]|uniref:ATPase n=2 Tax=Oenococcus oeni TaxID=1247 RepID=A0AAQ2ZEI7_OENOE|nr:AAA family ATPase [Oenococcus oeni]SYW07420.1 ATPase [Oenococcus oeni]VDB98353.1 ATPase [Oenococcus oeni]
MAISESLINAGTKDPSSTRDERFELTITAQNVVSTDKRFTMNDIGQGDNYKFLDAYYRPAHGEIEHRHKEKGERSISNQILPRLACQIFEKQLVLLPADEKSNFPICQYNPQSEVIRGIYPSVAEFQKYRNTLEHFTYHCSDGSQMVIYCWNLFSTILFVQECLKRFGNADDAFVLNYADKNNGESAKVANTTNVSQSHELLNPYSTKLMESKNIIFRGAPGTGKTYLANEIAADIVSDGKSTETKDLTDEEKSRIGFVQFHPSYDYTDFVEGLRPKINDNGSMGFELQDGVFKEFVSRAQENFDNSQKSKEDIEKAASVQTIITDYFANVEFGSDTLQTVRGTKFYMMGIDDKHINISIPENQVSNRLSLNLNELTRMLESNQKFSQVKDVSNFFDKLNATQNYSYDLAIYEDIKSKRSKPAKATVSQTQKPYVFIIDEINRGEISKIFGELFFAIDPGYRGTTGGVLTQYANLHDDPESKLSIPENVYIIGTMNDIDRSVDSFDFAMRRRFRFIEIKAQDNIEMLSRLGKDYEQASQRMTSLNNEIVKVDGLNENYAIGPAYFLKLQHLHFDELWADYLQPLLQDYVRGMNDEEGIMQKFEKAYNRGYQSDSQDNAERPIDPDGNSH